MRLTSPSFLDGAPIPSKHHYRKGNRSPELRFEELPAENKSLALICEDPDAPAGSWSHWVAWDIAPRTRGFREGMPFVEVIQDLCHQGRNDFGALGWGGPCPPSGVHRYVFTLYALDIAVGPKKDLTMRALLDIIEGHVIEEARLSGTCAAG
jgi:Raf kinase inhibitor-like YbhB/YbcL family protein